MPPAVLLILPKLTALPTVGAAVGIASAAVYDWLKLNAEPAVSCVAAIVPGEYTPAVIVPALTVEVVVPSVVSILLPEIAKDEPILSAEV